MNMVDVNDYLANIAQIARKCPTVTLRRAYMRAYREWCQQTQWLRTNIPGATVVDEPQYALGNDPNLDIIGIFAIQATFTPTGGNPQTWGLGPSDSNTWNPNVSAGPQPTQYQYVPEAQFAVWPTPSTVIALNVTAIIAPKESAVNVPQSPLQKYSNDIEAGALEYLLMLPGMPWSNPQLAVMHGKAFRSGISNGKAEAQRGYNVGPGRARPRQFITPRGVGGLWTSY
jgi:hypothetical protein